MGADPTLAVLLDEVRQLRAEVARLSAPNRADEGPALQTWGAVAEAVGVSVHTLKRRRLDARNRTPHPYFPDASAARLWYASLIDAPVAPLPAAPKRRASVGVTTGTTIDEALAGRRKRGRG